MTPLGALPRLSSAARRALVVSGLLSAGNAVALVVQAWALGTALARVVTEGVQPAELSRHLVVLAAAVLARAVLGWATEAVSARAAAGAKEELRALLLDSALRRGPEWIQQRGAAELTTIATKGLDSLDAYFTKYLPALVTAGVVPPLVGAWILFSDWPSAVTILLTVPLIPLFAWLVGKYTEQRTAKATDAVQRLSGQLLELIRALPVLTAFGRARAQGQVVPRVSDDHRLAGIATARVAVSIGLRLVEGNLTLATGLVVLILAPECYLPLRAAGAAHHASEDGVEAVRRVDEIVREAEQTRRSGAEPAEPAEVVLEVEQLRVRRREKCAPDGLTFTARPGEIVRLEGFNGIGPSGSGKSTTFSVLLGFTAPESGQVRCGGTDISRFDPASWRRLIAWVPQRPAFTGGTVREELLVALADQPP